MHDLRLTATEETVQAPVEAKLDQDDRCDLVILGAGPAGLTAAVYAARAGLDTLVLTGPSAGGQLGSTNRIENFPGFPKGIEGAELAQRFRRQAARFGARVIQETAATVDLSGSPLVVQSDRHSYESHTVIIATGAVPRRLGVPGERAFFGRGVSTCATCDGFFYKDKRVAVVGGGDSAIDEGLFLSRFAREVVVVHRRNELRATRIYRERAFANPKMTFVWNSVVEEIQGNQTVTGVQIRNLTTNKRSLIDADGVFIYVGTVPQTGLFGGQIALDDQGYVVTDGRQRTDIPGVFAAGDVQNPLPTGRRRRWGGRKGRDGSGMLPGCRTRDRPPHGRSQPWQRRHRFRADRQGGASASLGDARSRLDARAAGIELGHQGEGARTGDHGTG